GRGTLRTGSRQGSGGGGFAIHQPRPIRTTRSNSASATPATAALRRPAALRSASAETATSDIPPPTRPFARFNPPSAPARRGGGSPVRRFLGRGPSGGE